MGGSFILLSKEKLVKKTIMDGAYDLENKFVYLNSISTKQKAVYLIILLLIMVLLSSLPFVKFDISVKSNGIIRPISERTEVKPAISGIIDTLYYKEGDKVQKGVIILRIKDSNTKGKKILNQFETKQREQFIHDLSLLTSANTLTENIILKLFSPLYKEQLSRFLHQKEDQEASLKKANKDVEINTSLAKDKVISSKEFFDIQNIQEKILSSYKAFIREQQSNWQQDLARYQLELSQYQQQLRQVNIDASYYEVKVPVSGIIQGINTRYVGSLLQANETICTISPEENLIGECYVQTKDVGLLKEGQTAQYQIEAFDYNYFGVLTGKIITIDNDFTVVNNTPVIKVRCSFDSTQLHLKNGFSGQLKKGLNFQARFIITRRSVWQILFDKMDDWLNPVAPSKTISLSN